MLTLGRTPLDGFEQKNCVILDLPDGTRIRLWLLRVRGHDCPRVAIDAPRSVSISRGELLPPEDSHVHGKY